MRPIFLTIAGLNSYMEKQSINFQELTRYGLFGITGPTGSGKSTILDAITLALYGEMERGRDDFINSRSTEAQVMFEFEISGRTVARYRVERRYKRQKSGTQLNIYAVLSEKIGDLYRPLTEKAKETNHAVMDILGLTYDDFKRAVMLPQGKFSEFLMLRETERNAMLERILSYEHLGMSLREKIKKRYEKESLALLTLQKQMEFYQDATDEHLQQLEQEKQQVGLQITEIKNQLSCLSAALEKMKQDYQYQQELQAFLTKRTTQQQQAQQIEQHKERVSVAKKARELQPFIRKAQDGEKTVSETTTRQQAAQLTCESKRQLLSLKKEEYDAILQYKDEHYVSMVQKQGNLTQALALSDGLAKIQKEVAALREEYREKQNAIQEIEAQKEAVLQEKEKNEKLLGEWGEKKQKLQIKPEYRELVEKALKAEEAYTSLQKQREENSKSFALAAEEEQRLARQAAQKKQEQQAYEKELRELQEQAKTLKSPGDSSLLLQMQQETNGLSTRLSQAKGIQEKLTRLREREVTLTKEEAQQKAEIVKKEEALTVIKANLQSLEEEKQATHLHNLAAILADNLQEGTPCMVCGATHHPVRAKKTAEQATGQASERLQKEKEREEQLVAELAADKLRHAKTENELTIIQEQAVSQAEALQAELQGETWEQLSERQQKRSLQLERLQVDMRTYEANRISMEKVRQEKTAALSSLNGEQLVLEEKYKVTQESKKKAEEENQALTEAFSEQEKHYQAYLSQLATQDVSKIKKEVDRADKLLPKAESEEAKLREQQQALTKKLETLVEQGHQDKLRQQQLAVVGKEKAEQAEKEAERINLLSEGKDAAAYLTEIKQQIERLLTKERTKKQQQEEAQQQASQAESESNRLNGILLLQREELARAKDELAAELTRREMDLATAEKGFLPDADLVELEQKIESFQDERAITEQNINRLEKVLDGRRVAEEALAAAKQQAEAHHNLFTTLSQSHAVLSEKIRKMTEALTLVKGLQKEEKELSDRLHLTSTLKQMLVSNRFIEFIAKSDLTYITREASRRLSKITNGRYALEYDGKEFVMRDDNWGGYRRSASSLSGGEIFVTSLSLALALSTKIQLKSAPLEFFFLDEGFGTLDSALVDVVMSSLESLHSDRMTIGLITHVEELKSRLPVKLNVQSAQKGGATTVYID